MRAVLKRTQRGRVGAEESEFDCGDLHVDLARRRIAVRGQEIRLTPTEYNLLHELAAHRNQVVLHTQLLTAVWGPEYLNDLEYLRAYIRYLRQKLEDDPANPRRIVTSAGVGYMLVCPEESELSSSGGPQEPRGCHVAAPFSCDLHAGDAGFDAFSWSGGLSYARASHSIAGRGGCRRTGHAAGRGAGGG